MPPDTDLHTAFARLDERQKNLEDFMRAIADDQRRLSDSFAKLVESQQRLALVERDILELKKRFDEQTKNAGKVLWDIVKILVTFAIGFLIAKRNG